MMTTRQIAKPNLYQTVTDRILASLKAGLSRENNPGARHGLREASSLGTSAPGNRIVE